MASPAPSSALQARTITADPTGRLLRAARTRLGRRVSAGLTPPPGAYAASPAWRGREHWLAAVREACRRHPELLRGNHVAGDTVTIVARAMASYACSRTGRDCRPTNERLLADTKVSLATIKRARAFLRDVDLVTELVRGRSVMTRQERLQAWRNGSSHRQLASEFALTLPRALAGVIHTPAADTVEREPPPSASEGELGKSPDLRFFTGRNRDRRSDAARRTNPRRRPPTRTPVQIRSARLTAAVQGRVAWLSGVSPRRLTVLHRFAAHGWTERDVLTAIDGVLRARNWRIPDTVANPAAYLATLLREVDPADRPGAIEAQMLAEERARREWVWATTFGDRECVHGHLAGDLPHPIDGHLACPFCRKERS